MDNFNKVTSDWFFYVLSAILIAAPLPLIKKYNLTNNKIYLLVALFMYFLLVLVYSKILRTHEIIKIFPLTKILSIVIVFFVGIVFFHNKLTIQTIIGVILAIVAMYLLA